MPFSSKYSHLGKTDKIRIPSNQIKHVEELLDYYETICELKGDSYLHKIQNSLIETLDKIVNKDE